MDHVKCFDGLVIQDKYKRIISQNIRIIIQDKICFTVCQHISFKRIIPILENIGITHLFTPHKSKLDSMFIQTNIIIIPFILYPVNQNIKLENFLNDKYLYSFIGNYEEYYLSDIRYKIKNLKNTEKNYINIKSKWHFYNYVYKNQIKKNSFENNSEIQDINFQNYLKNSRFSLCPSGSGVNSIRLFESLSFGSIPIILSDNIILPSILLNSNCIILLKEEYIDKIDNILNTYSIEKINLMKKNCINFYKNFIKDDNFIKLINIYFNRNID